MLNSPGSFRKTDVTATRASALVVVLLFLVLLTGVSVTFLLKSRTAVRSASLQSGWRQAEEIGQIAVGRIAAELAAEAKAGAPLPVLPCCRRGLAL